MCSQFDLKYIFVLLTLTFLSCEKQKTDSEITEPPAIWGKLAAIKEHRKLFNGVDSITYTKEVAKAEFFLLPSNTNVFTDAGTVKINDFELIKDANSIYNKDATNLDFTQKVNWSATGKNAIPNINFVDTFKFPIYTGTLPFTISKSSGVSFYFDSLVVLHADSVRILIDDGFNHLVSKTYGAKVGNVTINASELTVLNNVADHNASLGIFPFNGKLKAFQSKGFYFIREQRYYQSLNIAN